MAKLTREQVEAALRHAPILWSSKAANPQVVHTCRTDTTNAATVNTWLFADVAHLIEESTVGSDKQHYKYYRLRDSHPGISDNSVATTSNVGEIDEIVSVDELAGIESPVSLSIERDLEDCLVQNVALIQSGLTLYKRDGAVGRQFHTASVGIIDLLALDKEGAIIAIELKAGEADDKAYAQLCRYMGWVKVNLAGGKPVRGILVASGFSEGCRYAAATTATVKLKKYEIQFKFADVSAPEVL